MNDRPSAAVLKMCARGLHYWEATQPRIKGDEKPEDPIEPGIPSARCIDCGISYEDYVRGTRSQ